MPKWSCLISNQWDSLSYQYDTWLKIWKAAAKAQAVFGQIPKSAGEAIQLATINPARVEEIEAETHHDLNSALAAAQESIPDPMAAKWMHYGMTSSDVVDTALHMRLKWMTEHWWDVSISRTVYPWPQTDEVLHRIWKEVNVGKIAGPVGTHASFPPRVEEYAMELLELDTHAIATQVISRDRIAYWVLGIVGISVSHGGREIGSIIPALENVALWHERDISHSSNERVYLPDLIRNVDRLLHGAAHRITEAKDHD